MCGVRSGIPKIIYDMTRFQMGTRAKSAKPWRVNYPNEAFLTAFESADISGQVSDGAPADDRQTPWSDMLGNVAPTCRVGVRPLRRLNPCVVLSVYWARSFLDMMGPGVRRFRDEDRGVEL